MFLSKYIHIVALAAVTSFSAPASASEVEDKNSASADYTNSIELVGDDALQLRGAEDFMLPSLEEFLGGRFDNLGYADEFATLKTDMVQYAKNFIGARYRRGASGPKAFDCSGFTSYVFKKFGMTLNRASSSQGTQGEAVSLDEAEVGDLIFFSGRRAGKSIGHVGIVIDVDKSTGSLKFIHASTSQGVRVENFPDGGYYSRRFVSVRRVLGQSGIPVASR